MTLIKTDVASLDSDTDLPQEPRSRRRLGGFLRRLLSWPTLVLAAISYIPLLLTARGYVDADTKQYLYLDPDRLLARAPYLWDKHTGMGGVTHQNIGYLLPQGPWFWFWQHLQVPDWVAQRLWTGTLLFAAGMGVLALMRTFGWRNRPAFMAAVAYVLSPYVLEYVARTSAILLPWAGLPWMVVFVARGLRFQSLHGSLDQESDQQAEPEQDVDPLAAYETSREEGHFAHFLHGLARWRYPALFALTTALIGGTNATSLICAGVAPVLWFPFALIRREVSIRDALAFVARTLVLTAGVSAWWISGLMTQAGYGLDVLAYSESVKTVASDSQASEVLRGLGNWYFYGRDGVSAWVQPSLSYTENLAVLAVSFVVPILALAAAVCLRWVHRAYFVTLVLVGTAMAVGVYPYDHPSPAGSLFKAFAEGSTAGLALRSTPRAVPLVALGLGVLLSAGVEALFRLPWRQRVSLLAARAGRARHRARVAVVPAAAFVIVLALLAANMLPLWRGKFVDPSLERPEQLPSYLTQAAAALNDGARINGSDTRVFELPGADFSYYRWGTTLDSPLPGLMDRPYVSRELVPAGTPPSASLVRSIDRRLQEGVYETSSLPALARLMGVGDVVLRNNLQYERFRTPQPVSLWQQWTRLRPQGLSAPKGYGPRIAETPAVPFVDEISLATPPNAAEPPALADFTVENPVPIVRAEHSSEPLLVAGNSEGLVDASAAGMLDTTGVVRFAATQTAGKTDSSGAPAAVPSDADLLLTDSNRKRAERWTTIRENYGYVETATGKPLAKDPNDARLPVFPDETTADQTVAIDYGVKDIEASAYGNTVGYAPSDRPYYAFDGDPTTSWKVGAFDDPRGERIRVDTLKPVTTDHLTLIQPYNVPSTRYITKARLTFSGANGTESMDVDLTDASRTEAGQVVRFPTRTFDQVEFTIVQTSNGTLRQYDGQSGVGLAELAIPGVKAREVLRLPTDLFKAAGTDGSDQRLTVMLTRDRANAQEPFKTDTELSMARQFTLPTARTFGIGGTARISAQISDAKLDQLIGRDASSSSSGGTILATASSSSALPGSLDARASAAIDGDATTAWTNSFGGNIGAWLQVQTARPTTLSRLNLQIIADGRHSVPTSLRLVARAANGRTETRDLRLPAGSDRKGADATVTVPVSFAPVSGQTFRLIVTGERRETTTDYFSHGPLELPVAIAELGAAGITVAPADASLPSTCRSDLLQIDGKPLSVQIGGATAAGLARDGLDLRLCGKPVTLDAGTHTLTTARGLDTGIDLDRLVLSSNAKGQAGDPNDPFPGQVRTKSAPRVTVTGEGPVAYRLSVTGATPGKPFWLVLGESLSPGWKATASGIGNLGKPQLVDGYANGWLITPTSANFDVSLDWTPQDHVWIGIGISAAALLLCVLMFIRRDPRHGRLPLDPAGEPVVPGSESAPALISPFARDTRRLSWRRAAVALIVSGGLAAALITPLAGLVAAACTIAALLVPRGRTLLRFGSVLALVISAAYVLEVQARYDLPETGQWVQAFHKVATISWLAVAFLVADVLVGWARRDVPPIGASEAVATAAVATETVATDTAEPDTAGPDSADPDTADGDVVAGERAGDPRPDSPARVNLEKPAAGSDGHASTAPDDPPPESDRS